MFHYIIKGLTAPVHVEIFQLRELTTIRELIVQLEIQDEPVKRRLLIHKIGTILRTLEKIPKLARIVGISQGYIANGEKRIFLAFYIKEKIADDFDLDSRPR